MAAEPKMPAAFESLLSAMYWPSGEPMPSEHLLIVDALGALRREEQLVAKHYIDELVGPGYSDMEIKKAWNRTSAMFGIVEDAGYRRFLKLVSEIIGGRS